MVDLIASTRIPQQLEDVDIGGLFTNPWFLVPFVTFMGWNVYKQAFKEIILVLVIIGVWYVSGTHYMQTLIVNGELQIGKILPVMFGGAAVLGVVIYMYFGRS
ncbi:MAG TPA: hypothetical protein ENN06_06145 [Desulfobacteraceae bacterium]|nr:hypothetical protein [Desulfobacteraceae bacterium]